jgi:eukaryotic-like serine/threonine-protein kinase
MQPIRDLIVEVHRRSLWQVLGIYLVGSWIAYEVVVALTQGIGLPPWVPGLAITLFVIGLPIVLATAFVQERLPSRQDLRASTLDPTLFPQDVPYGGSGSDAGSGRLKTALTWRRSLGAGVLAFILLGTGTTGFLSLRAAGLSPVGSLRAKGVVAENQRILIADFESVGGDTTMARLMTEAFRIDFARSTLVRPMDLAAVREVLRRMGRDDLPRLDAELAREVALRDGVTLIITGELTTSGAGHSLTGRIVAAETGEVLAAHRESARNDDHLMNAVDRISRALRSRTGEKLRIVNRAEPLAEVTTSSLEALRKFTEARRAIGWEGDPQRGRELLQEAVALDTAFAAAHQALAVLHSNRGRTELALDATARADRFRHRLTREDQLRLDAQAHLIRREYGAAVRLYEELLRIQPTNSTALNNLGIAHSYIGDFERAASWYERAARADSTRYLPMANLGEMLVKLGRYEEARAAFRKAVELAPRSPWAAVGVHAITYAEGDFAAGDSVLRDLIDNPETPANVGGRASAFLASALNMRGRIVEADERRIIAGRMADRNAAERLLVTQRFWNEVFMHERPERARALLPEFIRLNTVEAASASERLFANLNISAACAMAGDLPCARDYLTRAGREGELPAWGETDAFWTQGALAMAEQRYTDALRLFRSADNLSCIRCIEMMVGRTFELLSQPDSAIAAYERYMQPPSLDYVFEGNARGRTILRLARLHEVTGDRIAARQRYGELLALWERADPEFQPVLAEVRGRLLELRPDR